MTAEVYGSCFLSTKEIGFRVAQLRAAKGMTQEALAARIGVEAETVSRCETGHTSMALANLARVAQVFGVGLGDVVDCSRALPLPTETTESMDIGRIYLSMSPEAQKVALTMMRKLAETFPGPGSG